MSRTVAADTGRYPVDAFLGIGSNLEQPSQQIRRAFTALQALPESRDVRCSPLYRSPPMGPQHQPDYVNAVVSMVTRLPPDRLLREMQTIEQAQGRVRGVRWGARTLDIDLLVYGDLILDTPDLQIPHPGIAQRAFVLYPLFDLAPRLVIPGLGALSGLVGAVDAQGLDMIGRLVDFGEKGSI